MPCGKLDWLSEVCAAFHAHALKSGANTRMSQLDLPKYEKLVGSAMKALGLQAVTPHMFRHGGASFDAYMGTSASLVQIRGQWGGKESVLRYMKSGRYLRRLASLSDDSITAAGSAEKTLGKRIAKVVCLLAKSRNPFKIGLPKQKLLKRAFDADSD